MWIQTVIAINNAGFIMTYFFFFFLFSLFSQNEQNKHRFLEVDFKNENGELDLFGLAGGVLQHTIQPFKQNEQPFPFSEYDDQDKFRFLVTGPDNAKAGLWKQTIIIISPNIINHELNFSFNLWNAWFIKSNVIPSNLFRETTTLSFIEFHLKLSTFKPEKLLLAPMLNCTGLEWRKLLSRSALHENNNLYLSNFEAVAMEVLFVSIRVYAMWALKSNLNLIFPGKNSILSFIFGKTMHRVIQSLFNRNNMPIFLFFVLHYQIGL